MSPNKINFVCVLCNKILHKPIGLICSCKITICQEHVSKHNSFKCPKCNDHISNRDLKVNMHISTQLDSHAHLTRDEKEWKLKLENILDEIRAVLIMLKERISEFSLEQANHFETIRGDIDIRREILIDEIQTKKETLTVNLETLNRQSSEMIEQVELVEKEFRINFNQNVQPQLIQIDGDELTFELVEFFRNPYLHQEAFLNFECRLRQTLHQLKRNFSNFKLYEYDLMRNKFLNNSSLNESLMGRLELHNDFVKWSIHEEILNVVTCHMKSNDIDVLNTNTNSTLKRSIFLIKDTRKKYLGPKRERGIRF